MTDERIDPVPDQPVPSNSADLTAAAPVQAPPIAGPEPVETAPPGVPPVVPPAASPEAEPSRPRHGGGAGTVIAVAAVIAFVIAAFAGLAGGFLGARLVLDASGDSGYRGASRVTVVPSETDEPVIAAAAAAVPAVVNIDVRSGLTSGGEGGLPDTHPDVPSAGNGSGVAFKSSEDGGTYILTNNHVVEDADRITVRDSSGQSVKAELVGRDAETDIAVLLVDREIPTIKIADSADLIVGQTVVAIGSPFGLDHSVTSGVISALGRSLPDFGGAEDVYPLVDVIQTDAAINPGNSGGALVDREGRLVGINTAIYSDSGANDGIGFAVPSNTALRVADELIADGEVAHPFLGIIGVTVSAELALEKKLDVEEGAYVEQVSPDSGAAKGGVKPGDVVVKLEGDPIRSMDDLILQVRRRQVGETITLTVLRAGEELDVDVAVGDKPADFSAPSEEESPVAPGGDTP